MCHRLLGQLSNHIQSDSALHTLVRLKRTEGEAFTDLSLFCEVLHMLCVYKFRPKVGGRCDPVLLWMVPLN